MLRDCSSCNSHKQAQTPPSRCWTCLDFATLPYWEPIKIVKEKPMSGGMEDTAREDRELPDLEFTPGGNPCHELAMKLEQFDHFSRQVGGGHYKTMKIQPVEFAVANKLDLFQHAVIKYITRRKGDKNKRLEDLGKAEHYINMYRQAILAGDIE